MVVVVWLVLGFGLLFLEMHHLGFYALFGAVGALVAAAIAWPFPDAYVAQVIAALAVAFLGVTTVRPLVSRAFHRHTGEHVARGVHGGIVGQEAVTLDEVGDSPRVGHVQLAGERWLAVSGGGRIPAATPVIVTAVEGTTLVVWPVDGVGDAMPSLGEGSAP